MDEAYWPLLRRISLCALPFYLLMIAKILPGAELLDGVLTAVIGYPMTWLAVFCAYALFASFIEFARHLLDP